MTRAAQPALDASILAAQIEIAPGIVALRQHSLAFAAADSSVVQAILMEAARFASEQLEPLNARGEQAGPRLHAGKVHMPALHRATWGAYGAAGWLTLDFPIEAGGQGLPLVVAIAAQEIFDRSCPAFGMLPVPIRAAARLIGAHATDEILAEWLPKLAAGEWGATICISEVQAGSDAARIRTVAAPVGDGRWSITGEKNWISFGDHDLTSRIGHCLLARTNTAKGLSLFLVPSDMDGQPNGISVRRLEEKLGLHLSPTCALGFENSRGILLGEEGRGLAQMFVMITNMRMAVGAMGLGIACGATDTAHAYATERRQGGTSAQPVPILEHADVQRQLLSMHARVELLRGLLYATAVQADLARVEGFADAAPLLSWLLPIVKTLGGETAFSCASDAIQVLGGAGYTSDWPVEQSLRDARVLPVFEGTTGMQALDLLHRRLWRDERAGLDAFLRAASIDLAACTHDLKAEAAKTFDWLDTAARQLMALRGRPAAAEAGATPFLDLAGLAALGWIALRFLHLPRDNPAAGRLQPLAAFWLNGLSARAAAASAMALAGEIPSSAVRFLSAV